MLSLPEGSPRACHLLIVCCLRPCCCRLARAADHFNCITDVGLQTHPAEQTYQGAEHPLKPSWVQRLYHDVIRIDEVILVSALLSATKLLTRSLYHHLDPVPHYQIHHHVEDGGGQRVPLHHTPEDLEG